MIALNEIPQSIRLTGERYRQSPLGHDGLTMGGPLSNRCGMEGSKRVGNYVRNEGEGLV